MFTLRSEALSRARVSVRSEERGLTVLLTTDGKGRFRLAGLPAGQYNIRFEAQGFEPSLDDEIFLEPSQTLTYRVHLRRTEESGKPALRRLLLDYTGCIHQTVLDERWIHDSPAAHNVWFLVENQDLSATTNRIDVGGLWGAFPALFSVRGGCSWTQNIYQLNGLDVTDPYGTGMPLFYPDYFSLRSTRLVNAAHPPEALHPGGVFNLIYKNGTQDLHGGASVFFIPQVLQSSNISPALEQEGLSESHAFNSLLEGNIQVSGPVIPEKLSFFSSISVFDVSRDIADFEPADKSRVLSGTFSLEQRFLGGRLGFFWTGQVLSHPSFGAARHVPFQATQDRRDRYDVLQAVWHSSPGTNHAFKAGISYARARTEADFQDGERRQHGIEVLRRIPSGSPPLAQEDRRSLLTLLLQGQSYFPSFLGLEHRIQYGLQLKRGSSSSRLEAWDNLHLRLFEAQPLEVAFLNTPIEGSANMMDLQVFFQEALTFGSGITFYLGANLAYSRGWIPGHSSEDPFIDADHVHEDTARDIRWWNVSPRLGLIFPLTSSRTSLLKISLARYYFTLPLNYMDYGHPQSLGGVVYAWSDANGDRQFQDGEQGDLLRREGPLFAGVDPELKRPFTDELTVSYEHTFGSQWNFSLSGFYRENRRLIETTNVGVPFSAYDPVRVFDKGDDRIVNTHDDLVFTAYNQKQETLGLDYYWLTNTESKDRVTRYYGLDLVMLKKFSRRLAFFLTLTATAAIGTTSPGNTERENDDGVVGALYDNPNTLINAEGRVRFDRAYTGRVGFIYSGPWNINFGCVVKYYDGQPFTRKIIVTGFNQGPFYIQAFKRGVARYEYNRTVEVRLEKVFWLGRSRLRLMLDGFNILNRGLATEENEWTGPDFPLRYATEIQPPRVFRLGLAYDF